MKYIIGVMFIVALFLMVCLILGQRSTGGLIEEIEQEEAPIKFELEYQGSTEIRTI